MVLCHIKKSLGFSLIEKYKVYILSILFLIGLVACDTNTIKPNTEKQKTSWYNVKNFDGVDSIGDSPYDLEFNIEYSGIDGRNIHVTNCMEVASTGNGKIAEREFSRWNLLKADCEAAQRFYDAPESAISYWPSVFDFSLLKTFPATSIPHLGGQDLDERKANLSELKSSLILAESGKHNVKVFYEEMTVDYVELARGDFNRDGFQDIFVRMDWYVEGAFGDGYDWVVLTKISPDAEPMLLWRK